MMVQDDIVINTYKAMNEKLLYLKSYNSDLITTEL